MRTLRYVDAFSLQCAAATLVSGYQFRINSIYDPDYTGTGHQPYMHDQLAALYAQYRVHRIRATISAGLLSYDQLALIVGLIPRYGGDTSSVPSVLEPFAEYPTAQTKIITSGSIVHLNYEANVWDLLGVSKDRYLSDPNYLATFGSNPTVTALLAFIYGSVTVSQPTVSWKIELEFDTEITGLQPQAIS
jgi:hypothetical protein